MTKFNTAGLGGTFDHFHKGHALFLDISCYYSDQVHVGLISDKYLDINPKKFRKKIYKYSKRALNVDEVLLIALTAAATFSILDTYVPSLAVGARSGAGFGIGANLVKFPGGF